MVQRLIALSLLIGLASCRNNSPEARLIPDKLTLTSDAFANGQPIPVRYSCDGTNQAPFLKWSSPPAATKSFALVLDDPDSPHGTFHHWGVFGIPASARSLGKGRLRSSEVGNDFGKRGYGGPCPPKGDAPHHYHFKLFALRTPTLALGDSASVADVESEARKHALATGELIGTYQRQ